MGVIPMNMDKIALKQIQKLEQELAQEKRKNQKVLASLKVRRVNAGQMAIQKLEADYPAQFTAT